MSFADRYGPWAVVTGAAQGVGLAFTRALLERGCSVVLVDRLPGVSEVAAELGDRTRAVVADLAEPGWIDPLVFVDRCRISAEQGVPILRSDAVLGVLRLAPDHRATALAATAAMSYPWIDALRWALGGPLGILLTAATGASLIAFFVKNQKEIQQKMGRFKERIAEERSKFEEIQSGYRANRYDVRERNLMVDGQRKRFLGDLDEI